MQLCSPTSSFHRVLNSARGFGMREHESRGLVCGWRWAVRWHRLVATTTSGEKKTKEKKKQKPRPERVSEEALAAHTVLLCRSAPSKAPPMPVSMDTAPRSKLPHLSWLSASQRRFMWVCVCVSFISSLLHLTEMPEGWGGVRGISQLLVKGKWGDMSVWRTPTRPLFSIKKKQQNFFSYWLENHLLCVSVTGSASGDVTTKSQ